MALKIKNDFKSFNPNDISVPNGNIYGLPFTAEEASVILIPVPWEVTVSYCAGTARGPEAILSASLQVDMYDEELGNNWQHGICMLPIQKELFEKSTTLREKAAAIIEALGRGETKSAFSEAYAVINKAAEAMQNAVAQSSGRYYAEGKIVGLVGGDHSVSYGNIVACARQHDSFGILHIDAHADLRECFEGFTWSHASIMYNVLKNIPQVSRLVQAGIRDFCEDEALLIQGSEKITAFTDARINAALLEGKTWAGLCDELIEQLPELVYLSFDIDGLDPSLCPHTGTPVPGGLSFAQAVYLFKALCRKGKKIIGFDLVETAPGGNDEWDANVSARLLYKLCCRAIESQK